MRVLILATLLAHARGAPSGALVAPVAPVGPVAPVAPVIPVAVPGIPTATISPGDIQAAAINAKVLVDDKAQEAIDQARSLVEEAREEIKDKEIVKNDLIKEKNEELFWNVEEKKWQALDALKTAEAQIDGSIASNAEVIAKSAVGVAVAPYIAPLSPPIIAPLSPLLYAAPNLLYKPEGTNLNKLEQPLVKNSEERPKDQLAIEQVNTKINSDGVRSAEPEDKKQLAAAATIPAIGPVLGPLAVGPLVPVAPKLTPALLAAPVAYSYIQPPVLTPILKQW